jgi:hypothetical protein
MKMNIKSRTPNAWPSAPASATGLLGLGKNPSSGSAVFADDENMSKTLYN